MKLIYIYKAPGDSPDMNRVEMEMEKVAGKETYKVIGQGSDEFTELLQKEFTYEDKLSDPKKPMEHPASPIGTFIEIPTSKGGRRRSSKKRPTARRRSSNARKARKSRRSRKSRKSRTTRRK
jgi:hypothetical protein